MHAACAASAYIGAINETDDYIRGRFYECHVRLGIATKEAAHQTRYVATKRKLNQHARRFNIGMKK